MAHFNKVYTQVYCKVSGVSKRTPHSFAKTFEGLIFYSLLKYIELSEILAELFINDMEL